MKRYYFLFLALLAGGCSYDRFDRAELEIDPLWSANHKISELKNHAGSGTITDHIVVSGHVISSDSAGNIYKSLYISDNESVVVLQIGLFDLYERYPLGANVNLSLKGAACNIVDSVMQIGYQGNYDTTAKGYQIETINAPALVAKHLQRGIGLSQIKARPITIKEIRPSLTGEPLVIDGTFNDADTTIYAGERKFTDTQGAQITIYTSPYASFAQDTIVAGNVTIQAILAYHKGKPQLQLNSSSDIRGSTAKQ